MSKIDLFEPDLTAPEKAALKFIDARQPVRVRNGYFNGDRKISLKMADRLIRKGVAEPAIIHFNKRLVSTGIGRAIINTSSSRP